MLTLSKLFICFILFSFIGWTLEVLYGKYITKKFVNRGFLVGPLCPIYGLGCILIYLLLNRYHDDPIVLFIAAMAICSLLEYTASYLLEKIFKVRWWDYHTMKYNINGRICLEMIIPFGLLGLLVNYFAFPLALFILNKIPELAIYIIAGILLVIFIVDLSFSLNIIMKFKKTALVGIAKDRTEDITKYVRNTLYKQSRRAKRMIDSFPDFTFVFDFKKLKSKLPKIKQTRKKD